MLADPQWGGSMDLKQRTGSTYRKPESLAILCGSLDEGRRLVAPLGSLARLVVMA
jgi:hypothetical protein